MTLKLGINGFGRIGRLALRAAFDWPDVEFVKINDPAGDAATHAHLLNFDSVHGIWKHSATSEGDTIHIGKKKDDEEINIRITKGKKPKKEEN